jgi:hypothetical protein
MIAGDRCVIKHIVKKNSTPFRTPTCRSRVPFGHGNPLGIVRAPSLESQSLFAQAHAAWIPAFARMTRVGSAFPQI